MIFRNEKYKLTKDFGLWEFKVSQDHPELAGKIIFTYEDVLQLKILCLEALQPIRNKFGKSIVLSGKRDEFLNSAVGGNEYSDHLSCNAADIYLVNFSTEAVFKWVVEDSEIQYRQVIYYPSKNFIHISVNSPFKEEKHEALVKVGDDYMSYKEYYHD